MEIRDSCDVQNFPASVRISIYINTSYGSIANYCECFLFLSFKSEKIPWSYRDLYFSEKMNMVEDFRMIGGEHRSSYAKNSSFQVIFRGFNLQVQFNSAGPLFTRISPKCKLVSLKQITCKSKLDIQIANP